MLKILMLSLFFMSSCASWPNAKKEKAQVHAQLGTSLMESGSYPEALSALLEAAELDDSDAGIQNNLGLAYFYRGRPDKAVVHMENAIKINPKFTDARNNLGRVLLETEKYNEAEKHLKLATEDLTYVHPGRPFLNLGMLYFRTKRFKDAKLALEKSIQYDKSSCAANTLLGRSQYEMRDFYHASVVLDRAIGYCSLEFGDEAQFFAGMAYLKMGDGNRAKTRFSEIVKLYPGSRYQSQAQKILSEERMLR